MSPSESESSAPAGRLRVAPLDMPAREFESFTFPRYRPLVLGDRPMAGAIAVGAWLADRPVGLVLIAPLVKNERELLSIMVSGSSRRRGVGRRLLREAERLCLEQRTLRLRASHSTRLVALEAYEGLLRDASWSAPVADRYRLAGQARWALKAARDWSPFLSRLRRQGFTTSAWDEITPSDREEIESLVSHQIPEEDRVFNPLTRESRPGALPALSLLLRRERRIIGWLLGEEGALPDVVRYSHGYVTPENRSGGWLIAGLREVCQRQAELRGEQTISIFETQPHNEPMRRFMERQLDRYEGWMDARLSCGKLLYSS